MKSDGQLQKDVIEQLRYDPSVNSEKIGVSVERGVVILSGSVPSYAEKYFAEKCACSVSGVKSVVERIEVHIPGPHLISDIDIAKAIAETLEWHVRIPSTVRAIVHDGVVTLQGEVEWPYQKLAAKEAMVLTKGVKGINNLITLRPRPTPTDIKERIEDAMKRFFQHEADAIKVEVIDDKVILNGKVRSRAEVEEAKTAAWSAPGIFEVEDRLEILSI